eukprot:751301-Hanusia_phi.AAC.1
MPRGVEQSNWEQIEAKKGKEGYFSHSKRWWGGGVGNGSCDGGATPSDVARKGLGTRAGTEGVGVPDNCVRW